MGAYAAAVLANAVLAQPRVVPRPSWRIGFVGFVGFVAELAYYLQRVSPFVNRVSFEPRLIRDIITHYKRFHRLVEVRRPAPSELLVIQRQVLVLGKALYYYYGG